MAIKKYGKKACFSKFYSIYIILFSFSLAGGTVAQTQTIPSSVDPGRLQKQQAEEDKPTLTFPALPSSQDEPQLSPSGADNLFFELKSIEIQGASIFRETDFLHLYKEKLSTQVPASYLWELAGKITKIYQDKGYFLTRTAVPPQTINTGHITLKVIEGYIDGVQFLPTDTPIKNDRLVKLATKVILEERPSNIDTLESQLLRLNDFFGISFTSVLKKGQNNKEGTSTLVLQPVVTDDAAINLSINNYGSRFIGPYRASANYEASFWRYHKTSILTMFSVSDFEQLVSGGFDHQIQVTPTTEWHIGLSKNMSAPGFTLEQSEIESTSVSWKVGIKWVPIRQRLENLSLFTYLNALNSRTDIINTPLTRDNVRTLALGANYDFIDGWQGVSKIGLTFTKGLSILNASEENDPNLSRADAQPDFTKLGITYSRQSQLTTNLSLEFRAQGQIASGSLYSSEEFGFGGINAGRAYDFSEITGDQGISSVLELQYINLPHFKKHQIIPFVSYDIGKVWNKGNAALEEISAASASLGAHIASAYGLNADIVLAKPLTKTIDNPLHGENDSPVFRFGLNYRF